MIKLFSLKQQKKDGETAPKTGNQKKPSAAQLRITKGGWIRSSSSPKKYIDAEYLLLFEEPQPCEPKYLAVYVVQFPCHDLK